MLDELVENQLRLDLSARRFPRIERETDELLIEGLVTKPNYGGSDQRDHRSNCMTSDEKPIFVFENNEYMSNWQERAACDSAGIHHSL